MNCEWCRKNDSVEIELINIFDLVEENRNYPYTHEYDTEGKLLKVCPNCFTVDSQSLRGTRWLLKNIIENEPGYSRRDKKAVAAIICNKRCLKGEERKTTMSTIINQIKFISDRESEKCLASFFDVGLSRIQNLFYNVKIYRALTQNRDDIKKRKKKQQKNWSVVPAEI